MSDSTPERRWLYDIDLLIRAAVGPFTIVGGWLGTFGGGISTLVMAGVGAAIGVTVELVDLIYRRRN